jgi:hypothetical protein
LIVFDPQRFEAFCGKLRVDTKELGRIPLTWLGTQRYVVDKIAEGLSNDIHTFVILKGRQLGISTVTLALDLYWTSKCEGLQGAIVTDTDENREVFRSYIEQYRNSLPSQVRSPIERHNRTQLIFKNGSRLVYMVAGTKKKGDLGRAKSVNYMHATECSSWGDEEGFGSLVNTLAQKNPNRLYILESTARGYNMFYQTWEVAKNSNTQMAIFVGWWRNELYSWPADSPEYLAYWDGAPTSDERQWIREVFERYAVEITPEQIAWWRWYCTEQMKGDENLALQEMPPTEDYAFQLSGSKFFSSERVNQAYQYAIQQERLYFRYEFGLNFEDTRFLETNEDNAELVVWETPRTGKDVTQGPPGRYVLGADPAYGSSEWADEFAGNMLRCYADRVTQVAELGTTTWTEQQFAWVIAHLAGWYGSGAADCMLNLEMQGPGGAVFNELTNLKRQAGQMAAGDPRLEAFDVIGRIRDYLFKRQDSIHGAFAYQWQTNPKEKLRMMSTLRSYFERDMIELNSPACVQQFRNVHRQGDKIGGEGRAKDDRVISLAIGVIAWNDWIKPEMEAYNRTYAREMAIHGPVRVYNAAERSVLNYLNGQQVKLRGFN